MRTTPFLLIAVLLLAGCEVQSVFKPDPNCDYVEFQNTTMLKGSQFCGSLKRGNVVTLIMQDGKSYTAMGMPYFEYDRMISAADPDRIYETEIKPGYDLMPVK